MSTNKHANRLIHEKSPYLLQHAHNPVDWYPWGEEAFKKARAEDKPIFLSIGYSTCHWCHVMERESFEDKEVAEVLNQNFVSIKVDREERPDIDHIYMTFCQALTGHGGWPLTIILTPDQKPFYAGTYFPKKGRMGMPGILDILNRISKAWKQDKESLIEASEQIFKGVQPDFLVKGEEAEISDDILDKAYLALKRSFEPSYGGFSTAPKFPTPHNLSFLLRYWKARGEEEALRMVEKTLDGMARGGIFDHIGYGFSRYSTDQKWLVPHFEKMLYDNALLTIAYLEAFQCTGKEVYRQVAEKVFTYVLRDMTSPEGGFYSAEDADSEGEEGKFYLWKPEEIKEILGESDGQAFCEYYGITPIGNFEGKNIPNRIHAKEAVNHGEEAIAPLREKVFEHRERRFRPYKDDKILTSWNGLMIAAMAIGGKVLENWAYTQAAERAVEFILDRLVRKEDGRLLARYREGEASHLACVDDYAYLVWGLIELYETTYKPIYLHHALHFNGDMVKYFWDEENGGLFLYGKDGEQLIARPKEIYDGALPSGNSVAALNFLRLARLTGDSRLEEMGERQIRAFGKALQRSPAAYTHFMTAVMFAALPGQEIVVAGEPVQEDTQKMLKVLRSRFMPQAVILVKPMGEEGEMLARIAPFVREQKPIGGKAAAYVCQNFACQAPVTDPSRLAQMLKQ